MANQHFLIEDYVPKFFEERARNDNLVCDIRYIAPHDLLRVILSKPNNSNVGAAFDIQPHVLCGLAGDSFDEFLAYLQNCYDKAAQYISSAKPQNTKDDVGVKYSETQGSFSCDNLWQENNASFMPNTTKFETKLLQQRQLFEDKINRLEDKLWELSDALAEKDAEIKRLQKLIEEMKEVQSDVEALF